MNFLKIIINITEKKSKERLLMKVEVKNIYFKKNT